MVFSGPINTNQVLRLRKHQMAKFTETASNEKLAIDRFFAKRNIQNRRADSAVGIWAYSSRLTDI